jgi:hypothetical protein
MKAKTIHGDSPEKIQEALRQSMDEGYHPTLAIVFISIKQDRKAVCTLFQKEGIQVIGATSSGEFVEGHESKEGIVAMLLDLDPSSYRIILREIGDDSLKEAAEDLLGQAQEAVSNPSFILLSTFHSEKGLTVDGGSLIQHITEVAGPNVNLFGGMAGDDISFTGTFVFTDSRVTDYGIVALVLDEEKVRLRGVALSGWKPIGISRTITKAEGNMVYTIDDQPALETYLRVLGIDPASIQNRINFFSSEAIHYPIQISREGRQPLMCNPIGYDEEKGAIVFESEIPQGTDFRFSTPPDFDIVETVLEKAEELKEKTGAGAEALLIFSCAGRLSALGPLAQQENDGLHELWEAPMAGFYTYGEFGKAVNGKHEFHSTTNSWVVLTEKEI